MKRIDLRDFAKEIGKWSEGSVKELKQATIKGIAKSIPDLVAASPVDTGMYAQSWDFHEEEYGAIIGNYAPYAGVIEDGARPFKPPLGPLLAWAKRVTGSGSQPPDYDSQVWALALHTQKKIESEGMKPRHVLENAIPGILKNIKQEMEKL
jgi:hypothetical protein